MDLVTLVTACALTVDPKLMHALVWHQSGGEPWAVAVQGEPNPRAYSSMNDAIREIHSGPVRGIVRVGLAGVPVVPARVSASVLLPCRNVAMAAVQINRNTGRCKAHPRLKADPTFCAVAIYRGSWERPDVRFASDVATSVTNGDAPNFDMPRGTSTEIIDIATDLGREVDTPVIDVTATFAEQFQSWSSALFPTKPMPLASDSGGSTTARSVSAEPPSSPPPASFSSERKSQDRNLFVRRVTSERP